MVTNPNIVFVLYIISFIDLSPWISLFSIDVCIWSSTKAVSHWRQIGKSKIVCKPKNCQQFQSVPGFIFDLCLFLSIPFLSLSLSMKIGSSWCRYSCEPWRRIGVRRDSFRIYSQWWQIGNGDRRWHNTLVEYTPKSTSSHTKFKISKRKVSIFPKKNFLQKKTMDILGSQKLKLLNLY